MNLRSLREQKLLSQERLAEMSGLSLRTIQRAEAGHRVSYASLRSLAATLEIDVDLLERELYAVKKPTEDDFVEVPRWVRVMDDTRWFGPGPSRRDAHFIEAFCVACAVGLFVASVLVTSEVIAKVFRAGTLLELAAAYLVSRYIRTSDKYRLWAGSGGVAPEPRPRTWRTRTAEYTYWFGVGILGIVVICWLATR